MLDLALNIINHLGFKEYKSTEEQKLYDNAVKVLTKALKPKDD